MRTSSAVAGLAAALAVGAPAAAQPAGGLPVCAPGPASTRAPAGPAGDGAPLACRATGHLVEAAIAPREPNGYRHLGAGTGGEWGGVSGRVRVVDTSVRAGSYDFVAARFMVKRDLGGGTVAWLEAGWAQTGWAAPGRQQVYTFNTNSKTWQFYDQYTLKPGDRVWVDLHTDAGGGWQAWLWWNNRWNLLTEQRLPIGGSAYVEQYLEVHAASDRPEPIDVPQVAVDDVRLRPAGGGTPRAWRADVATLTGDLTALQLDGLCLNWVSRYDRWTAGTCRAALARSARALTSRPRSRTSAARPRTG